MKPIGTITMDFQFVGKVTQRVLTEIMEHAPDYSAYVDLLCAHVMDQPDVDNDLILLALRHSEYLGKNRVNSKILDKYRSRDVLFPYYLVSTVAEKDEWTNILLEIERVIQDCNTDWISFWYLIHLFWLAYTRAVNGPLAESAETQIKELVQKNESLQCYMPQFHYLNTHRVRYEGGIERAIEVCKTALELSRKLDDKYFESRALKQMGTLIGYYNFGPGLIEKAKPFLREARKICEELGDTRGILEILSYVGGMCATRGEFSESKNINLEVLELREQLGDYPVYEFHNAAFASIRLGEGKEALEWAKTGLEHQTSRSLLRPYLHLDKAAALVILQRLDEAEVQIDIARELNLKTGLESGLAYEYMVNGLLERAKGDLDSAFHSFESALEINERNSRFNRMVMCLLLLAETEIASFEPTSESRDDDLSGPWLERFDRFAKENELPGFIGNALFLKSELRLKQGRHNEAQKLISEVLRMSRNPGLEYLRQKALILQEVRIPRERS